MPVIRDYGNGFQQTLGVPINSKSGKDILKKTSIDIYNKRAFGNMTDTVDILEAILNTKVTPKQYENASKAYENAQDGVRWSQFEWKTYDTQMEISIEDTIEIEGISKGEIILSKN